MALTMSNQEYLVN